MKINQPLRNPSIYFSIVIPIYNEQETLPELYIRITQVMKEVSKPYELIFVNDGSCDRSLEILRELHAKDSYVKFVSLSRNFGHQVAISAGVNFARGRAVVIMDGDLQDPPEVILLLIAKWQEGYDVVYAVRKKRQGEELLKVLAYKLFYRIIKKLTHIDIPLDTGDFRIISRRVVDALKLIPERNRFVRGLTSWVGFKQIGIEYIRHARFAGNTKYSWSKLVRLAFDGITSFSFVPLQLATYLGFFVSALCIIYALHAIYARFFMNAPPEGWASLMVGIMLLGGVQLITLGIIGEYLGRIFDEVKQRPIYITDEACGFGEKEKEEKVMIGR
jgi:polyisoprenyl-phosphate glycosyltransferase